MSTDRCGEEEAAQAPFGHVRFAGSNVEVVVYPVNDCDLCVLMNKAGVCVYRATLKGALDPDLQPLAIGREGVGWP